MLRKTIEKEPNGLVLVEDCLILSIDTLSVAQLRHYAEDAGKKTKEIMKIKKPKITLSFLADGVAIQE